MINDIYKKKNQESAQWIKKRIKIVFGIILSILIIGAVILGYVSGKNMAKEQKVLKGIIAKVR